MRDEERACTSDCTQDTKSSNGEGIDDNFAEALSVIVSLPLTDAEKVEAVRRLLLR